MYSGFLNLFLGLLLQFNIVFRGVDILPDVVGYYLIYKGLKILVKESRYFEVANKLIIPLMVLSLANIYNFQYHQDLLLSISFILDTVRTLVFALNIYLVFLLYKGMIEVVPADRDHFLERNLQQRLYLYLGVSGVFLILSVLSLVIESFTRQGSAMQSVFLVTYITYLFALLIVIGGVYKVYKELSPAKARPVKAKARVGSSKVTPLPKTAKTGKPLPATKSAKSDKSKRKR